MEVRIYKPSRSTMQAGLATTKQWVLEYSPEQPRTPDPLMGWTSARDTRRQIRLHFETLDRALNYAGEHGLDVDFENLHTSGRPQKSYADNFAAGRLIPWSH